MPLMQRKPFQRLHVSSDFKDDDEVFHCEVTDEIFKDYNEYCSRIILCNSLIWSCSITGKSNLTFAEALQHEENAKKCLEEFPMELRTPILYLASKTNRSSLTEMLEDVFHFAKDRYFVGEVVEVCFANDSWRECQILQVVEPTAKEIAEYNNETESARNQQERQYHPPAKCYSYEVEEMDSENSQCTTVKATQVRRKKQYYSRDKNKLFLRQLCEPKDGHWVVKDDISQKYSLNRVRFDSIFVGNLPDFATAKPKKPVKHKQESMEKFLVVKPKDQKANFPPKPANDPMRKLQSGSVVKKHRKPKLNGKFKEELKAKALEEKAKQKAEKQEERDKKKEEKAREKQKQAALAIYVKEWNKPREDLECEDLYPIPQAIPVKCSIPNEKFGSFAMVLEFLEFFKEELEVTSYFSNGVSLDLLEKALWAKEAAGPWSDLLQLLLSNIFKFQIEEEDEIQTEEATTPDELNISQSAPSIEKAVEFATKASHWCQTYQGCHLSETTLDHVTLSEILRQHLLSSGGRSSEVASKWRYSQRGGYKSHDDPALLLRITEAKILRFLSHRSVCELDVDQKLTVATCLIDQLLAFASIRDAIEERYEKITTAKKELKSLIVAEQKREKEEREKLKEREKEGKADETDEHEPKKVTRNTRVEERKREDFETRLRELQKATKDDQMMLYLGADRAHRRYWRLLSIPGLFVESDEWFPGTCLPNGTPHLPELKDNEATIAYLKNKFEDELSDKENIAKKAKKSPKKVAFVDKNGVKSPRKEVSGKKDPKAVDVRKQLMACTGDAECPVHRRQKDFPKWSFYGHKEDIEAVIQGLSKRGYRESDLRNNLVHETQSIIAVIEECPRHKLNSEVFKDQIKESSKKPTKKDKYENANLRFPADMEIDKVMELTMRDYVVDLEDRIRVGCLGTLKVKDRDAWRTAINNCDYDKQCDRLTYGANETDVDVVSNTSSSDKVKHETRSSRANTPDSEVGSANMKVYRDPGMYLGPPKDDEKLPEAKQQQSIRQMACAILQLSHAVETKYLKKPLGDDEKDKKWNGEEAREKWEQSLMASTSWSQLFLHFSTLENSIAWSKSALNAQCRICRRRKDPEKMLLCDGCNKGHHLYCLKPKLTSVPEGDWFCTTCKPREVKPKDKKRKRFEEDHEEEVVFTRETRHRNNKKIIDSDSDVDDDLDEDDTHKDKCTSCGRSGKLIYCDECTNCYHLSCIEPRIGRAPRGRWACSSCKDVKRKSAAEVRGHERDRNSSERPCAALARSRIHGFAKSLLTRDSTDWSAEGSSYDDLVPRTTRGSMKRAAEVEDEKLSASFSWVPLSQELLNLVKSHRDSWPFLSPVTKDEVPDYDEFISTPMDFGTIRKKLDGGEYNTLNDFYSDCLLVFDNCQTYNTEHSSVYKAGQRLLRYLEKQCKELGLLPFDEEEIRQPNAKKPKLEANGDVSDESEAEEQMEIDEGASEGEESGDSEQEDNGESEEEIEESDED